MLKFVKGYRPTNEEIEELYDLYSDSNVIDLDNITLNYTMTRSLLSKNGKFRQQLLGVANPITGYNKGSYVERFMRSNVLTEAGEKARFKFQELAHDGQMSGTKFYNFIKKVNEAEESGIKFKNSSSAFVREAIIAGFVEYENHKGNTPSERGVLRFTGKTL
nr:MAG TPA: hypothetical protein [Caudoviricetes sp.]